MRRFFIALAATSVLSGAALAQTTAPATAPSFVSVKQDAMLSYNLVGLNVRNAGDENVGEIKDLVLDQGRLTGYILSVGGFLGMGDRYVVVDPAAIKVTYGSDNKWHAVINATKDQLKAAPEFKYEGKWKR